jgi:hypothetical protein
MIIRHQWHMFYNNNKKGAIFKLMNSTNNKIWSLEKMGKISEIVNEVDKEESCCKLFILIEIERYKWRS